MGPGVRGDPTVEPAAEPARKQPQRALFGAEGPAGRAPRYGEGLAYRVSTRCQRIAKITAI